MGQQTHGGLCCPDMDKQFPHAPRPGSLQTHYLSLVVKQLLLLLLPIKWGPNIQSRNMDKGSVVTRMKRAPSYIEYLVTSYLNCLEKLGGVVLLEEVCHWGFEVSNAHVIPRLFCVSCTRASR